MVASSSRRERITSSVGPPPRYRIERREDDKPALIVDFAHTDLGLRSALAVEAARHLRARTGDALVAIDQASDAVIVVRGLPLLG